MKYMLLIYHEEQNWHGQTEPEHQAIYHLAGDQLQAATTARSVRVRNGKQMVTDGPFAETREQLGGFFMIEATDLDEARSIAARIPSARTGTIEIRPVMETARPASA